MSVENDKFHFPDDSLILRAEQFLDGLGGVVFIASNFMLSSESELVDLERQDVMLPPLLFILMWSSQNLNKDELD